MFEIWDALLNTLSQFVIPDWGALIALIPIAILTLAVVVFAILFRRLLSAPGANRGFQRIEPGTPAGIHMPGPSLSPILAAVGAFMLVLGVILGGTMLIVGGIAFALTLVYWLAEAMRVFDRESSSSVPPLPVVAHDGPPAGVHMPGPSFRPLLGAIGATLLMLGLVFGGWLLAVGAIALVVTLLGWLVDAVKEYRKTVEADQTGHLENIPAPRTPALLLGILAVLLVGGIVLQSGILPPKSANGEAGTPGASGGPPSASASAAPLPAGDVTVTAQGITFVTKTFTAPANTPFTIVFDNQAAGVAHDVDLIDASGTKVVDNKPIVGASSTVYNVGALPAGTYTFICSLHPIPDMTGTATLGAAGAPPAGSSGPPATPPSGSGGPPATTASAAPLPAGDVTVTAQGFSYVEKAFTAPANTPFTITFDNRDRGVPHDIDLFDGSGAQVFDGKTIKGVEVIVYDVGALPAGTYKFICSFHPTPDMTGTATLQ